MNPADNLEAVQGVLSTMIAQTERALELAEPVERLFPGMPLEFAPTALLLMGNRAGACELAVLMAYMDAETAAELEDEAIQAAAQALLTAYLPDIARMKKARRGHGELANTADDDVVCRDGEALAGRPV